MCIQLLLTQFKNMDIVLKSENDHVRVENSVKLTQETVIDRQREPD